jgi:hypothetical protein
MQAGQRWHLPLILSTWEADIGKTAVQGQPWQIVHETPSLTAKWTWGVVQVVGYLLYKHKAKFKPRSHMHTQKSYAEEFQIIYVDISLKGGKA